MEAGREELITLLKRLDGRHIPDHSPERMSDYEAMRIHVYRDPQVDRRVWRGGSRPTASTATSPQPVPSAAGIDPNPFISARATEVYFQAVGAQPHHARGPGAGPRLAGRHQGPQVRDPRLRGLHLRPQPGRVQEGRAGLAALATPPSTSWTPAAWRACPLAMTAEFGPPIDTQDIGAAFSETIEASEGAESLASDSGGFSVKNTNDLSRGHQAHRRRVAGLLPARLQPHEHAARRPLPQDPGQGPRPARATGPGAQGLLRAPRGQERPGPQAGRGRPRHPGRARLALRAAEIPLRMTAYVFDETLLGKANVVVVADMDVREFAFQEEDGRFLDTLEFLLVAAHRETRRVLPLRPEGRDEAPARHAREARLVPDRRGTSSWPPAATRPRSWCGTRTAGASGRSSTSSRSRPSGRSASPRPSSATRCSRRPRARRHARSPRCWRAASSRPAPCCSRSSRSTARPRRRPRACPRSRRAT